MDIVFGKTLSFEAVEKEFDCGNQEEAEEEGEEVMFDWVVGFGGGDGTEGVGGEQWGGGNSGFFAGGLGGGEAVFGGGGGAVAVGDGLAVAEGGEARGVAVGIGLDGDDGGLAQGVADNEGDGLAEGVSRGAGLCALHDGSAASATRQGQGSHRYEGSR